MTACALTLAVGVTACGGSGTTTTHLGAHAPTLSVASANNNGAYVDAGNITYQLQISRELNQYSAEDSAYVKGLPAGTAPPAPDEEWYGVFLWAKNQTNYPQTTTDNFELVDTQGDTYFPIRLDPNVNPFAWTAQRLPPQQTEPLPNTPASMGPTQGGLLLFKVNDSVYANRPLTLFILGPDNQRQASISLDL